MPGRILTIDELALDLPGGRLVALDLGTKTIGLAVSDVGRRFASPVATIARTRFTSDAEALLAQAAKLDPVALVMGLPLNMDGSEGPRAQASRAFVRNMAGKTELPFVFWDERLSTVAATRSLIEQDMSRAKRAKVINRVAAAYILQGLLDRLTFIDAAAREGARGADDQYP